MARKAYRRKKNSGTNAATDNLVLSALSPSGDNGFDTPIKRGIGSLTHPANDSADYERYVPDHEGIYRGVKQNASRHYGARIVENLDPASEDITQLSSNGVNTTVDDTETVTITTNTNNAYRTLQILTGLTFNLTSGISAIVSFEIENISGNGTIGVRVHDGANNYNEIINIDLTTLTTSKRFSIPVSGVSGGATPTLSIEGRSAGGGDGSVTGSFKIKRIMFEESTGRLDTTTPSEYVSTGVATGEEKLINYGFIDGTIDPFTAFSGATATWVDGEAEVTSATAANTGISDTQTFVIGQTYLFSATVRRGTALGPVRVGVNGIGDTSSSSTSNVTLSFKFIATSVTHNVQIVDGDGTVSGTFYVDNATLKRIDHGDNVDGQKSFSTERSAIVVSNVVQELSVNGDNSGYVDLDGTGDYVSTPDSVANSITGDIDIRALVQPDDWTPTSAQMIVSKLTGAINSYDFYITGTSGLLTFRYGPSLTSSASSIAPTVTDGEPLWVRVTRAEITGTVRFYTSVDGEMWAQLGADKTTPAGSIFDSAINLHIGTTSTGTANALAGKIYRAQIFNEIDGTTPVVDFNPGKDSQENDTAFTSSTGEVWTTQADASLHKLGLPLGRNLISNNGLSNDTLPGTGGNFQDNLGDELVTNNGFDTDTDWAKGDGWTISGGTASCDGTQTSASNLLQLGVSGLIVGNTYLTTFTVSNYSAGNVTPSIGNGAGTSRGANGTYTEVITYSSGSDFVNIQADANFIGDIDNVSVKEVTLGATGWTANDAAAIIIEADGNLRIINGDATVGEARTTITTEVGKTYTAFVNNGDNSAAANTFWEVGTSAGAGDLYSKALPENAIHSFTFVAAGTTTYISTVNASAANGATFDIKGIYITPGIPLAGLMMEGAATNLITEPRDLTNAAWTETGTSVAALDAVGIDGQPNSASTLTDDDGAAFENLAETVTIPNDSNPVLVAVFIKKDSDTSRFVGLDLQLSGGTALRSIYHANTSTGAVTVDGTTANAAVVFYPAIDMGLWWLFYGVGTNNSTGNVNAILNLYPSISTVAGTTNVAATGSAIFDAVSIQTNKTYPTSPILATGGATRPADNEYTLAGANWTPMDANGSVSLELTPLFEGVALAGIEGIMTPNETTTSTLLSFSSAGTNRIRFSDETAAINFDNAWQVSGQTIGIKTTHNSTSLKQDLNVDGTDATQVAYDGSYNPSGSITLGKSLTYGMCIRNLKLYSKDKGTSWRTT